MTLVVEIYMYSAEIELIEGRIYIDYLPGFSTTGGSGTAGSNPSTRMTPWRMSVNHYVSKACLSVSFTSNCMDGMSNQVLLFHPLR